MTALGEILMARAAEHGRKAAFVAETKVGAARELTYSGLFRDAIQRADALLQTAAIGDRVVVSATDPLEVIVSLYACFLAGIVAVPVTPKRMASAARAAEDDDAVARLARATCVLVNGDLRDVRHTHGRDAGGVVSPRDAALIQFTSGTTAAARGVVLTNANIVANTRAIARSLDLGADTIGVSWLPLHHDMGLIGSVLTTVAAGSTTVLLGPERFLFNPLAWLEAISRHRATFSGAPAFAYAHCAERVTEVPIDLDLSSWRVAAVGAEPIGAAGLARFATRFASAGFDASAFYPCYGLAESVLFAAGGSVGAGLRTRPGAEGLGPVVSCGHAPDGHRIEIVDPETRRPVDAGAVGEIWISGPSVAVAYWGDVDATDELLAATVDGDDSGRRYLRTGDLGLVAADDGELYVRGRLKDVIVVRGRTLAAHEIEATAAGAHGAVVANACAAIGEPGDDGEVVRLLCGVARGTDVATAREVVDLVRRAVASRHGVALDELVVVPARSVARTTSGKVRRRRSWEAVDRGHARVVVGWRKADRRLAPEGVLRP